MPRCVVRNSSFIRPKSFRNRRFDVSRNPAGIEKIDNAQSQMHQQPPKCERLPYWLRIAQIRGDISENFLERGMHAHIMERCNQLLAKQSFTVCPGGSRGFGGKSHSIMIFEQKNAKSAKRRVDCSETASTTSSGQAQADGNSTDDPSCSKMFMGL